MALPQVQFDIMNLINQSTGFSLFQIHLGRSPCDLPPLINSASPTMHRQAANKLIARLHNDVAEAHNNL